MNNDLFLRALRCEPVERPPVWLMRQAGRYMPQYRLLREKHTLWEMFHKPEIAATVTQQPLQYLGVDAAILFSDILVIAEALGLSVQFPDKGGPCITPAIHTPDQVVALPCLPVDPVLSYVFETIREVKKRIDIPLIGFSGGPFTIATYCIDSSNHGAFERTKRWIKEDPLSLHMLLAKITEATIAYLQAQVKSGVDAIQVFDSWASALDETEFDQFCVPYLQQIVDSFKETTIPVLLFCRSSSLRAEKLAKINPAAISFDWHLPMKTLRAKVPASIAIQGNFNPEFLKLPPPQILEGVQNFLSSMQGERGVIVNLGHGVLPDTPVEHVRYFVDLFK